MRIDVRLPPGQIELDLAALARRLPALPGPLMAWRPAAPSTATLLWRSAPSGVYVYVVPADRRGRAPEDGAGHRNRTGRPPGHQRTRQRGQALREHGEVVGDLPGRQLDIDAHGLQPPRRHGGCEPHQQPL